MEQIAAALALNEVSWRPELNWTLSDLLCITPRTTLLEMLELIAATTR